MKPKNKYYNRSRISEAKFREVIKYFCADLTAEKISEFTKLNRNTINKILKLLRERISEECNNEIKEKWIFELDESYFWPTRIRWKRWRWAGWKTIVFWLLKRNWKVYTEIVPNAKAENLIPIIRWKIDIENSTINSDWWKAYDWLVDLWYEKHYRVHHWKNEFARWKKHINWIESFWSFAKRRLRKFNWINKNSFLLHLKETEFRFNLRNKNLYDTILKVLRKNPLN